MRLIPLFSGSSGNCILIEGEGTRLLVDAGLPARSLCAALATVDVPPESIAGILVTHGHSDHVRGVGVLARKLRIPVFANAGTWEEMEGQLGPLPLQDMRVFCSDMDFYLNRLHVTPFLIPHDAREPVGFCFEGEGQRIGIMTDVGHVDEGLLTAVDGTDLLLIEANHDVDMLKVGPYPYPLKRRILSDHGHLSNDDCGKALARLYARGLRCAILGHLSRENNFEQLALETVRGVLRSQDIPDADFALTVAHRDRITGIFDLKEEVAAK